MFLHKHISKKSEKERLFKNKNFYFFFVCKKKMNNLIKEISKEKNDTSLISTNKMLEIPTDEKNNNSLLSESQYKFSKGTFSLDSNTNYIGSKELPFENVNKSSTLYPFETEEERNERKKIKLSNYCNCFSYFTRQYNYWTSMHPDDDKKNRTRIKYTLEKTWSHIKLEVYIFLSIVVVLFSVLYYIDIRHLVLDIPIYMDSHDRTIVNPIFSSKLDEKNIYYSEDFNYIHKWIKNTNQLKTSMTKEEIEKGFFYSSIYNYQIKRNVSIDLLLNILKDECKDKNCDCISALNIGIPRNIILLNSHLLNKQIVLIEPIINSKSDDKIKTQIMYPSYLTKNGYILKEMEFPQRILILSKNVEADDEKYTFQENDCVCVHQFIDAYNEMFIQ